MLNAYFAGNLISEWDTIFYNDIAPLVFEKIMSSIGIAELALDFSSEVKYRGGERQIQVNLSRHDITQEKSAAAAVAPGRSEVRGSGSCRNS